MKISTRRLEALATHLEKLEETTAEKRRRIFAMGTWWERVGCGTAACAMGEACYVPLLKRAGLRLLRQDAKGFIRVPALTRRGQKYYGDHAAMQLFGIDEATATEFFMPRGMKSDTPGKVAAIIRSFLDNQKSKAA